MIVLLPNRREIDALHALKNRGFAISTIRFPSGTQRNVAIDADRQHSNVYQIWKRFIRG